MKLVPHQYSITPRQQRLVACVLLILGISGQAWSQAGVGLTTPELRGLVGSNKDLTSPTNCPAGTLLTGMYHVDKAMTSAVTSMSQGMTNQIGIYCSRIVVTGATVSLEQTTPNGTPAFPGYAYPNPGTTDTKYCPAGTVVQRMGGSDRRTANSAYPVPWTSSMTLVCRPLNQGANDWLRISTTGGTTFQVGTKENNATHNERGPWCGDTTVNTTVGYYRQGGGEGYDGVNIYCSNITQARHSAVLTFVDFAWSQLLGTGGWTVALNKSSTALAGIPAKTPHTVTSNSLNQMQVNNEAYVIPGSGYGASLGSRPAGIELNHFVATGNCLTGGITLANEQDNSCSLQVAGRPDLAVAVGTAVPAYTSYDQVQTITMSVASRGPRASKATDGFTLDMQLPAGWTAVAGSLPAACTLSGQLVRCALNPTPLAAATAPDGSGGGQTSFAIPVRPAGNTTAQGTAAVQVQLGRSVPDASGDLTRVDFNTANDQVSTTVELVVPARLWLDKITPAGAGGPFTVNLSNASPTSAQATTASAGTPAPFGTGSFQVTSPGSVVGVSESGMPAGWRLTAANCSNQFGTTAQPSIQGNAFNVPANLAVAGAEIRCTLTNQQSTSDLALSKTSAPVAPWRTGQAVTYTLTARNNGPDAANGSVLRDPAVAGLNCATFTCAATGSAQCGSASGAASMLQGAGLAIPQFPVGGQVVVTLSCTVTASGVTP